MRLDLGQCRDITRSGLLICYRYLNLVCESYKEFIVFNGWSVDFGARVVLGENR